MGPMCHSDMELISNKGHVLHIERCHGKPKINCKSNLKWMEIMFGLKKAAVCAAQMEKS